MKKRAGCKCIAKLLSVVMLIGCLWTGGFEARALEPDDRIELSESNFPDSVFRTYLKNTFDKDGDGYISASGVTQISVSNKRIGTLTGIEFFPALKYLDCGNNNISTLDVTKNTALEQLYCYSNKLSSLDLSKNLVLEQLHCNNNEISTLDVSQCHLLYNLSCANNKLTELNLSQNPEVSELSVNGISQCVISCASNGDSDIVKVNTNVETVFGDNASATLILYVNHPSGTVDLHKLTGIDSLVGSEGWNADTKILTYTLTYDESLKQGAFASGRVILLSKAPCSHDSTYTLHAFEATCYTKGYTGDKICSICGETIEAGTYTDESHGETEVKNVRESTCSYEGYTGDKICKNCQRVVETGTLIDKIPHKYVEGVCSVCGASETEPPSGEWKHDSNGWWYQRADGSYPVNIWEEIDGKWYLFDNSGYRKTGWQKLGDGWYYLNSDGSKVVNETVDGRILDANGVWVDETENTNKGTWKQDSVGWWYQREDGTYPAGAWEKVGGKWYLFNAAGYMLTGWQKVGGAWYYMYDNGAMAFNTTIDGYVLGADGAWTENGWRKDSTGWWYKRADGSYPYDTWEKINGAWYHFDVYGYMQTGWLLEADTWYYATEDGAYVTGWKEIGKDWYYFYDSCAMAANTVIDGYRVAASGEWVR